MLDNIPVLYLLIAGLAVLYLVCLRLILGPRREVHPEYPFVGLLGLGGLYALGKHLFETFHIEEKFSIGLGVIAIGTLVVLGGKSLHLIGRGWKRGLLWVIKLVGIFFVIDFLLFYLLGVKLTTRYEPSWYSFIEPFANQLGYAKMGYHMYAEDKSWYEWFILLDCGFSIISFLEGIPAGLRLIKPRMPVLPTALVMLCQLRTRRRKVYCPQCEKNLSYRDMVHYCPVCRKISTIKLMNSLGTVYVECENETCNAGKRKKFSRITPVSKRAVRNSRIRCKTCSSLLTLGNSFVTLSLYSNSPDLVRSYRRSFCKAVLTPNAESSALKYTVAPEMTTLLGTICAPETLLRNVPLSPIRISLNYAGKKLNQAVVSLRAAIAGKESNALAYNEGTLLLLEGKSEPTQWQAAAESLVMELERLNTEAGGWKEPVLVGICADGCAALTEAITNGFASAADMEQQCIEFLENQNGGEIVSTLGSAVENVHFFVFRFGDASGAEAFNIVLPVQALLLHRLPALKKHWAPAKGSLLPPVTGKYSPKS